MRRGSRSSSLRLIAGSSVIVLWSASLLALGGALTGRPATILGPVLGALFALTLSSLGEWLVHGLLYHRTVPGLGAIRRIHHHGHHFALFPPQRYAKRGGFEFMRIRAPLLPFRMAVSRFDNLFTKFSQVGLHAAVGVPLILLPAWLIPRNVFFLAGAAVMLLFVSWLLAHVHGAIHTPRRRWIEGRPWFAWLDRHHYIHHVDLSANLNFMLPLCDWLFGTLKRQLDERERGLYPSYEAAREAAPL